MSDSNKEKRKKFTDMVNEQKSEDKRDDNNQVVSLEESFLVLKERAAQLEDHLRRAVADNENIKRIMQKQISDASDYAVTQFARDIIDLCDNLKRVMENLKGGDPVHEGIKVAHQKIMSDLKKHGIKEMDPIGELFDSNLHQAVVEREDNEKEVGTIVEVLQTGFTIKTRLLRPAMVVISKKSSASCKKQLAKQNNV
ncbi:nucleotide exchange factor GrpE [Wolbachia endosymbiont of Cruorifilaria tuberocauda]|uniref:nucleotide exchange factor GrpE n=1 Tax=Wolbachia endosymbiont of Cruorifilaria tuberocauda TaxID=1812111 RepID=UPI00158C51A0|nr:nucleotide exchange factor GrpE [Wolbachia endosymbiont of Cruorifilaria tuberocauda]QKX01540.1 nucleotide exchange factor GrpE [Wolbachia endosymbiont of Cruorifilaria tuberocauda]